MLENGPRSDDFEPARTYASDLIQATGEMAELVRSFDWSTTALGSLESWRECFVAVVNVLLLSPIPAALYCGPDRVLLYNDAFRPFTGLRHPGSLGAPGAAVWKEAWHVLAPQLDAVFTEGRVIYYENFLLPLEKDGVLEDSYWTYSYSPVYEKGEIVAAHNICQSTTKQVAAEQKLRESEARALRVFESIGDAVIVTDAQGCVARMNPVAQELTGWTADEARDHPLPEVFPIINESTRLPVESPADKVKRLGTVVGFANHTILLRKDGTEVHIDDSAAPIRGADGGLIGMVLVFRDVGEKREIERGRARVSALEHELTVRQELLLKLLQRQRETNDPAAMLLAASEAVGRHLGADRVGFFEIVDDNTSRLTVGWTAGELPLITGDVSLAELGPVYLAEGRAGRTHGIDDMATHPLTQGSNFAKIGVRSGIGVPIIRQGRWQAGFYVHCTRVREWTEGEVAFAREVANQTLEGVELALAQQAVRRSEERARRILESIGDAVFVTDAEGRITGMNPVAERLIGWPVGEARGATLTEVVRLVDERSRQTVESALLAEERLKTVEEIAGHTLLVRRDGTEVPVEQSGSPIREDDGRLSGMVLILRDATERQTTEQRLRQAYKMEALGQLTGGIAHDFNNILAIIMGNLELIAEATETDGAARDRIEQAVASAERAADLTRRLLAYARQQPLEPAIVDVRELVTSAAEFMRRSLGPTVVLRVSAPPDLWAAKIDRNQFENALLNLAVNSRDAMPGGGELTIQCENFVLDRSAHEVFGDMAAGEYLLISVSDTGTGMSKDALMRATEPFFTTKPIGHGTGLGLSMVYGFMKQSGGHMQIESELGVGTMIMLYLPRALAAERQPGVMRQRKAAEPLPRGHELILVVEDEFAIRRTIVYLLDSLGYRVIEAEDGPAAMACLQAEAGIDLLLTDVILPKGMSGPALAKHAKTLQPRIKAIFSSGYTSNVLTRDYSLEEGVHLLTKPFHLTELAHMVRRVLDGVTA